MPQEEPPLPVEEYEPSLHFIDPGRIQVRGITSSLDSVRKLLANPEYRELLTGSAEPFGFNEMLLQPTQGNEIIELNSFVTRIRCAAEQKFHFETTKVDNQGRPLMCSLKLGKEDVRDVVMAECFSRRFNPVADWLVSLRPQAALPQPKWIEQMATDAMHLTSPLDLEFVRKWAISCVARALDPGCKVDTVLVLIGSGSMNKSTFLKTITSPGWFSDTQMDLRNKDRFQQLHGAWIYEWAELASMRTARDLEEIKGFLSSATDNFRAPYEAATAFHKRHTVIVGSNNQEDFLRDAERRFWPITIKEKIDLNRVEMLRENFWVEALQAYDSGEPWWFDDGHGFAQEATERLGHHVDAHPWQDIIAAAAPAMEYPITIRRILIEVLKFEPKDLRGAEDKRVGVILRNLGWKRGTRARLNGVQIIPWTPPGCSP